ncbi:MAG: glycosyltransferase family 4 protein [Terriglobia bacterium]
MRVLFLSQLLPFPLDAGPKLRSYYVLRYLAEAGHQVTLVCFVRPNDRRTHLQALRQYCHCIETIPLLRSRLKDLTFGMGSLCTSKPFLILRDQVKSMDLKLEQILARQSFDAFHVDQLGMAPYATRRSRPILKVLDQHNAVFTVPLRMAQGCRNPIIKTLLQQEAFKLRKFERQTCESFDRVVWVTDQDRAALDLPKPCAAARDTVIPIATDPTIQMPVRRPWPFRVTFIGGMHWPPNAEGIHWFFEKIWPRVIRQMPRLVLTVIGSSPPKKIVQSRSSNIQILGYVTNLKPYLAETAVCIVPLRSGAGMRVKILDAWCWGIPIVSTSLGAEGMRAKHRENLLIADEEESFANSIVEAVGDQSLARRSRRTVGRRSESHYHWRELINHGTRSTTEDPIRSSLSTE